MSGPEQPETGDEIQIEVSDVRSSAGGASPPSARSPFEPRYTPRQRVARVAAGLLALAVVLSSITGVGGRVLGLLAARTPTPTLIPVAVSAPNFPATFAPPVSTVLPAANLFYLLPNPPGVEVSVDGHVLTSPPLPGDPHPLRLSTGHHVLAWISHLFPFAPLRCTISAPHVRGDTCPFVNTEELSATDAGLAGHVIAMHASLAALPTDDAAQLTQAVQAALSAMPSQTTVQSGEQYLSAQQGQNGSPTTTTQPLRATLSYEYFPDAGYFEPCILTQPAISCRFPGQDCSELCTVPQPPLGVVTSPDDWIATAEVHASWSYMTPNDHVVAQNVGEVFGLQLAVLRITWDGALWHVTPILGTTPGLPATDDLVCDPARFWLEGNNVWSFMMDDPPPGARTQFISDAVPTDGCLAVLNPYPRGGSSAVFLERFGVLVAVNDVASGNSGLPMADAAERQQAQQLAAQAGFTIS